MFGPRASISISALSGPYRNDISIGKPVFFSESLFNYLTDSNTLKTVISLVKLLISSFVYILRIASL